jgi:hypothetical protein
MKIRTLKLIGLIVILSFLLASCGAGEPAAVPSADESQSGQPVELAQTEAPAETVEATEAAAPTEAAATEAAAAPSNQPDAAPLEGNIVSDIGFRPEQNGFGFENYGGDANIVNLTPADVQRMFGDQVCANTAGGQCELTPPGAQWMEEINGAMSGGHCEGMATLSLILYNGQEKPADFGSGNVAAELTLDQEKLQREIAYWWATQVVNPTSGNVIKGTPSEILDILKNMKPGEETYTIGIYKRDGSGGHAITPFGVEEKGDGVFDILVYDNNYPKEIRRVQVDTGKNTWQYEASINPDVAPDIYEGDADTMTLDLTPTSARMTKQDCPFCANTESARVNGLAAPAKDLNEIFLDGDGHLLIMDENGKRLGFADGKLVNEIPGAEYTNLKVADTDYPEPIYRVPAAMNVTAVIDGSTLKGESTTDLVMIGNGFSLGVEGIALDPNQMDTIAFQPVDNLVSYDTDSSESPNIVVGIEQPGKADYYFEVQGADMQGGGTISVMVDRKANNLVINTEKLTNEGKFTLILTRVTDEAEESFQADDIVLKAGAMVYIEYGKWEGNGKGLYLGVDTNGDGEIDDEYEVADN